MNGRDGLRAVLWDMDGTLVDSEKLWDVSLHELARHLGGELSEQTRDAMVGSSLGSTIELMFSSLRLEPTPDELADAGKWLTSRTEELFLEGLPWRPGAHEALRLARRAGLATALVTSTQRQLVERALDSIGREHFDVTVCGDEVPAAKPAPDPYLMAARLLGVPPGRCLAVEDSPTGASAAEAAGCAVLVVPSEVAVPAGPARIQRDDLRGLTEEELHELWRRVRAGDHWSSKDAHSPSVSADT
ncbi:MAG TPA: HAD family phosphatase [Pseudonocardia sp.]|jgi:HAD superfamily hydrolase (TIGR01509 family)|uniref:HAD family hydrolase n=1 Tax=Pseudonocardia sp. TaxID=60912 RepID=UPI002F40BFAD